MSKNIIVLSLAIVVAAIIFGGFYYSSQLVRQQSVERQQDLQSVANKQVEAAKTAQELEAGLIQIDKDNFENSLKCNYLLKDLTTRWDNVVGIYYSPTERTCIVKYTEDSQIKEGNLEQMQDQ